MAYKSVRVYIGSIIFHCGHNINIGAVNRGPEAGTMLCVWIPSGWSGMNHTLDVAFVCGFSCRIGHFQSLDMQCLQRHNRTVMALPEAQSSYVNIQRYKIY